MPSRSIFTGDCHISPLVYASLPRMRGDAMYSFQQIVDDVRQDNCWLHLMGDVWDCRPSAETLRDVLKAVDGLNVSYLLAQHDFGPWLDVQSNHRGKMVHMSDKPFDDGHIAVHGLDRRPAADFPDAISDLKSCDVVCLHQLVRQVIDIGSGEQRSWDLDLDDIKQSPPAHLFLMADWHGIPNEGKTEYFDWMYSGSTHMRSINEPSAKSYLEVYTEDDYIKVRRKPLKTRPFLYYRLHDEAELEMWRAAVCKEIANAYGGALGVGMPEYIAQPLVAVKYDVDINNGYKVLTETLAKLSEDGVCHVRLVPARSRFVSDSIDSGAQEEDVTKPVNMAEIVSGFVDAASSPTAHRLISDLIAAAEPADVITAFCDRILAVGPAKE